MGERAALDWLIDQGASVFLPFGHSPDVDLVAWYGDRYVGIQVKTTTVFRHQRWDLTICTRGGNQSWNRLVKRFSAERCDYLFAVVGDGRRWFIPAAAVAGGTGVQLGGPKYADYEVEPGRPLLAGAS